MRNREIHIFLLLSIFLLSFNRLDKDKTRTISSAIEGVSFYELKCNKRLNEENKVSYQYFLEIYSDIDPKKNFDSDNDYANYTQFHLQELFKIKMNGVPLKVYGARLEQGIKGANVYRINLYFEKDSSRKIKNLEVDFNDRLFENKNIIFIAKKVNL